MLDIKWIRDNPKALVEALTKRSWPSAEAQSTVDGLIAKDEARREHVTELQTKQERRNAASKEIGNAMRSGDAALAEKLKAEVGEIKTFIQNGEARERELDKALNDALAVLPNVPLDDVPVGKDEHDNVVRHIVGKAPTRPNWVKEHFEIGEALGMMDFERAAKLSGSRFTVLKGGLARMERAIGQFMLDLHTTEHGYEEVIPPLMVKDDVMFGTGQLPKFEEDLFSTGIPKEVQSHDIARGLLDFRDKVSAFLQPNRQITQADGSESDQKASTEGLAKLVRLFYNDRERRYLIPTAEVPLTNLVREEITAHEKLPLRYTALTPCFRSEAGSAGRDTRGMLRQHQFYKVELVSITDQDSSLAEHERMTQCAEEVLKRLELPFRTMVLCTGDMGFGARKTYDIEVWLPGQNAYREISSCSVCGDFQARRMDARYKDKDGKGNRFVHTLNGSGTAVGRALIAVIENYQNEDGSVTIPEVLRPYMGGLGKIESK
ncbi:MULTISPECIES: serine--tRNA ligase [unclassified Mesorhizobium]|uniref:serine--tRNA ligase n=1 Tax=unclassified Mesorhizobium TaxID=325217 RepID=UPI000FDA1725|nr:MULTISPECIES: serine--tRNA ligase [unclassified Mesorhizobium]TGR38878.1 serine--tRNA ligase [bacterium M00.F.Ca.ET.199.01.1.1]TGU27490.1 serine--tRNA ligase [bacterium M00.F.Ca.ET.156.01.1.1]TGV83915.1 serine--tRNA ligase [Mesorhizobium sp. M00.F.Ca.ET.149.01.1.1]TGQ94500.1 serine--tRNA ligase [Mesorhizobium sp. M8A.F.Ca.ET.208.01.1.1]TGR20604.1 serine--tRNA ligase [Mesorhizobium sp. M8A.F.Ca.ET.202.01.1.1]